MVTLISYGCKWGTHPAGLSRPPIDMRKFPNPYHNPELRKLRGTDAAVQKEVWDTQGVPEIHDKLMRTIVDTETIGVYCTAGHHRSVAMVELLADTLRKFGYAVQVQHRDIEKGKR